SVSVAVFRAAFCRSCWFVSFATDSFGRLPAVPRDIRIEAAFSKNQSPQEPRLSRRRLPCAPRFPQAVEWPRARRTGSPRHERVVVKLVARFQLRYGFIPINRRNGPKSF